MGLDTIHSFANSASQNYSIRVDIWDCTRPQSLHVYEVYNNFWVRFVFAILGVVFTLGLMAAVRQKLLQ